MNLGEEVSEFFNLSPDTDIITIGAKGKFGRYRDLLKRMFPDMTPDQRTVFSVNPKAEFPGTWMDVADVLAEYGDNSVAVLLHPRQLIPRNQQLAIEYDTLPVMIGNLSRSAGGIVLPNTEKKICSWPPGLGMMLRNLESHGACYHHVEEDSGARHLLVKR